MFKRRPPEKRSGLMYSESSKNLINELSLQNMLSVADAVALLEHARFRDEHKTDLRLVSNGNNLWSIQKGYVWLAYHEEGSESIYLDWVSIISKFRRK